jgi:hypothetical protein
MMMLVYLFLFLYFHDVFASNPAVDLGTGFACAASAQPLIFETALGFSSTQNSVSTTTTVTSVTSLTSCSSSCLFTFQMPSTTPFTVSITLQPTNNNVLYPFPASVTTMTIVSNSGDTANSFTGFGLTDYTYPFSDILFVILNNGQMFVGFGNSFSIANSQAVLNLPSAAVSATFVVNFGNIEGAMTISNVLIGPISCSPPHITPTVTINGTSSTVVTINGVACVVAPVPIQVATPLPSYVSSTNSSISWYPAVSSSAVVTSLALCDTSCFLMFVFQSTALGSGSIGLVSTNTPSTPILTELTLTPSPDVPNTLAFYATLNSFHAASAPGIGLPENSIWYVHVYDGLIAYGVASLNGTLTSLESFLVPNTGQITPSFQMQVSNMANQASFQSILFGSTSCASQPYTPPPTLTPTTPPLNSSSSSSASIPNTFPYSVCPVFWNAACAGFIWFLIAAGSLCFVTCGIAIWNQLRHDKDDQGLANDGKPLITKK